MIAKATYGDSAKSEKKTIKILKNLLDENEVTDYISENDKTINVDGFIELLDIDGGSFGKIEVQVKTLKTKYSNPAYSIKDKLYNYVRDSIIPVIVIAVDQENKKAFWHYLSRIEASRAYNELDQTGKKSKSIQFKSSNEISLNQPYDEWRNIISEYRSRLEENEFEIIDYELDESLHPIDQLFNLFQYLYNELEFVPPHLLAKQKPFNKGYSYFSNYTLSTDNVELFDALNSIKILENGEIIIPLELRSINDINEKTQFIFQKLHINLVAFIQSTNGKNNEYIDLRKIQPKRCNCSRCKIERFEFDDLDISYLPEDLEIKTGLTLFYSYYKLGSYKESCEILKYTYELTKQSKSLFFQYLIFYNISKLRLLLRNDFFRAAEYEKFIRELEMFDLDVFDRKSRGKIDHEIFKLLKNDYFLFRSYEKTNKLRSQILKHRNNTRNGGFGSNQYIESLLFEFSQLHCFLYHNKIVFDCFTEYLDIVDFVLEGLLASSTIKGERNSKIEKIEDWHIEIFIEYGRLSNILYYFKNLEIYNIDVHRVEFGKTTISPKIVKLIRSYNSVLEFNNKNANKFEDSEERYRNLINNTLAICSKIEFHEFESLEILNSIVKIIRVNKLRVDLNVLFYFLKSKSNILNENLLNDLLEIGYLNDHYCRTFYFAMIGECAEEQSISLQLRDGLFNKIIQEKNDKPEKIVRLSHIFSVLNDQGQKGKISQIANEFLTNNFIVEVFNWSALMGLVQIDDDYLAKSIIELSPKEKVLEQNGNIYLREKPNYSFVLDQFINLCFKEDLDFKDLRFSGLKNHSNYYNWLLDIDGFDYQYFHPSWLNAYDTIYYFKAFSKSIILKNELERLMKNSTIENYNQLCINYSKIYISKTWER